MLTDQELARLSAYVDAVTNQQRRWVYVAGAGYRLDDTSGDPIGLYMAGTYFGALDFLAWRKETGVAAT